MSRIDRSGRATIGADGSATLSFGPSAPFTRWEVRRITVQALGSASEVIQLAVHQDTAATPPLDVTPLGGQDSFDTDYPLRLFPGQTLILLWTGGVPGAQYQAYLSAEEMFRQ